jgi:hypothetical protein
MFREPRSHRFAWSLFVVLVGALVASPVAAGVGSPVPLTDEFRADHAQPSKTWQYAPHAIALGGGRTAVIWEQDLDGIFARFLDASGAPEGGDRRLVASTGLRAPFRGVTNLRRHPSAQALPDGGFLLAWTEERTFITSSAFHERRNVLDRDVMVQRFASDGTPASDRSLINAARAGDQSYPQLVRRGEGGFAAVWRTVDADSPERQGIYLRAIAGTGAPQGSEVRVDTGVDSEPGVPSVAFNTAGAALVAWDACCDAGGDRGVFARAIGTDLAPAGAVFRVNDTAAHAQTWPAVAASSDGEFLVAWQAVTGVQQSRYGQRRVRGQLVGADGGLLGPELLLSSGEGWGHDTPRLSAGTDGSFLLTWLVYDGDFPAGIASARLAGDGERTSDAAWVSESRTIGSPASVHAGEGRYLVTWLGVLAKKRSVAARFVGLE